MLLKFVWSEVQLGSIESLLLGLSVAAYTYNHSTQESEAGGLRIEDQSKLRIFKSKNNKGGKPKSSWLQ